MRSYGQYCPIARGAQVLGDRWTLLIVRELSFGVVHFNELERCLPGISRSVLAQRLRELIRSGIVSRQSEPDGSAVEYTLTAAGEDLGPVLRALGEWAARWSFDPPDPDDLDPDLVIRWISRHLETARLPARRVVLQFDVHDRRLRRYWIVARTDDVSVCLKQPGYEPDIRVIATTSVLYDVYLGRSSVSGALRTGALAVDGDAALVAAMPDWFGRSGFAAMVRRGLGRAAPDIAATGLPG